MVELLLDNKNGNVWDISSIVTDISWKTVRIGQPGSLEFTLLKGSLDQDRAFEIENGNVLRFKFKNHDVFYGYVFSIDGGMNEGVKIKAYDQLRYLQVSDTYVFKNVKASQVVRRIGEDFGLNLGRIDDTVYRIPTLVEDGQKLFDIICKALDLTLINRNLNFVLFDDFGKLSIRNTTDMVLQFIIGDQSLMYDYEIKRSIDDDTYNRVKLVRDNKDTGKRDVYIAQDSRNIAKWGTLQLYQSVEENRNAAQIKELLDTLITLKNRESKTLKLEAIGNVRVRAGCYVPVIIKEYGINQPFLVDECTHHFNGADHTMTLDFKVVL